MKYEPISTLITYYSEELFIYCPFLLLSITNLTDVNFVYFTYFGLLITFIDNICSKCQFIY